ncbi:MAG: hypothetical protein KGI08_08170 [Thaumarchaeota archaeon]|nr:hypothetical protein [Nitrososphaerota archaeon]
MSLGKDLQNNAPFIGEAIFLLVIMMSSIGEFTYIDIITHDFYSLPIGAECYTGNNSDFCKKINTLHNCPTGGDACIESMYAQMLTEEIFWLSGMMLFIKVSLIVMFKRQFNVTRIFQTIVWTASPAILIFTGFEDYLFFAVRKMPIPSKLPWMDSSGLFPFVNQKILHISTSSSLSLYIVMGIGMMAVITLFAINIKLTKDAGLKTPI